MQSHCEHDLVFDATGEKMCSVPTSSGLGVLSLLVRNEEENVDWECGSLAIPFASGGMLWFGGGFGSVEFVGQESGMKRRMWIASVGVWPLHLLQVE